MSNSLILKQIADYYLLHELFSKKIGLLEGKMGISLFFYLYARYTNNHWHEEFANELLDDIYNELSTKTPITFADGLCGIGWGIELLKSQGIIEGDVDDILCEVDLRIMERDICRIYDYSLETGLVGIVAYVRSRLDSVRRADDCFPFDTNYLENLNKACQKANIDWKSKKYSLFFIWKRVLQQFSASLMVEEKNWKRGLTIITQGNE